MSTQPTIHAVSFYPALFDLSGRPVLVVGGGQVAESKVAALLAAGASVTVIAPRLSVTLAEWSATGRLVWIPRRYRNGDLHRAFIAFAAASREVNHAVWLEAERRRIPINSADDPSHCSFILPAVHRDGDLVIAVSTGGKAPALAVRLRDRIAATLGSGFGPYLDLLGSFRREISRGFATFGQRRSVWYRIVDSEALGLVRRGDLEAARHLISAIIEAAAAEAEGAA